MYGKNGNTRSTQLVAPRALLPFEATLFAGETAAAKVPFASSSRRTGSRVSLRLRARYCSHAAANSSGGAPAKNGSVVRKASTRSRTPHRVSRSSRSKSACQVRYECGAGEAWRRGGGFEWGFEWRLHRAAVNHSISNENQ